MRVIWKDSLTEKRKPIIYRGYLIEGTDIGWSINLPGDNNIYKNELHAKNAIDKALGLDGMLYKKIPKRHSYGIEIIGKKNIEQT